MFDRYNLNPDDLDLGHDMGPDHDQPLDHWLAELDISGLDLSDDGGQPSDLMLDVPYVPSDDRMVQAMLDLAEVGRDDLVYDLGCGDGRIVVTAALERGARGIGLDIDPMRIAEAMELAGNARVEHMTNFIEADLLEADFSDATVVMLYLLDLVNLELRPRLLEELRPGTRIISNTFDMDDWKPDRHLRLNKINLYKWLVPAPVAGGWEWEDGDGNRFHVELEQKFQKITGRAWLNDSEVALHRARLQGDLLELCIRPRHRGKAHHFTMRWQDGELHAAGNHGSAQ